MACLQTEGSNGTRNACCKAAEFPCPPSGQMQGSGGGMHIDGLDP